MLGGRLARRPWRVLFPALLLFFFIYSLSHRRTPRPGDPPPVHKTKTKSFFPPLETKSANSIELDYCQNFPTHLLDEVQVVLKVSSSETSATKAHLSSVTSCITNLIIVGDREERLGDRRVIDILAELPKSYEVNNLDFQAYVDQKKAHVEGESQRSFKLDRFKYLPMVDKAYTTNPKAKWFVFLESDVYFFWDTLFRLLSQLESNSPHYLGEPHKGSDGRYFAYGGAGFVLSQGLMKKLIPPSPKGSAAIEVPRENRLSHRFEDWIKEEQRGDAVLSYAIQNATGVRLAAMHPTFSSYQLKDVKTTRDRWCYPLLSLHQLKPEQMENLWKWERTRQYNLVSCTPKDWISKKLTVSRNHLPTPPSSRTRTLSSLKGPLANGGITCRPRPYRTTVPLTATLNHAVPNAQMTRTVSSGLSHKLYAATPTSSSSATPSTGRTVARATSYLAGTRAHCASLASVLRESTESRLPG
jgi:hypothetical protein